MSFEPPFIPLVDLKAQYVGLRSAMEETVAAAMARGDYILGEAVGLFEEEFAAYCGTAYAVGCASGTDALQLAFRALGLKEGEEVILPAMTFAATAFAVVLAGGVPVLVDVDPATALMDANLLEAAITRRTRAICPVHLYGQCAAMETILDIARRHGLAVVEDAAQAHGAFYQGSQRAGSMGDMGCFSFYPGKNLGGYGDGGCITTNDENLAKRLRTLRNLGSSKKYYHQEVAPNSRLDTLQAAVLRVKLPHLDQWNQGRRHLAHLYDQALRNIPVITLPSYQEGGNYHLYVLRVQERDSWLGRLNAAGLGAGIHYPFAIHQLQAFHSLASQSFPNAEMWAATCLSLPIYAEMPMTAITRAAQIFLTSS